MGPAIARWSRAFVGFAVALTIVVVVMAARSALVVPLAVALVAAVACTPVVDRLEARRIPRPVAALAATGLIVLPAVVMVVIVILGVVAEADELAVRVDPPRPMTERRIGQTSSMRAIGALSPWRVPSFRMRV